MRTIFKYITTAIVFAAGLFATSCDDDTTTNYTSSDPIERKYSLGSVSENGFTVTLFMDEEPYVGANRTYVRVYRNSNSSQVTDRPVYMLPDFEKTGGATSSYTEPLTFDTKLQAFEGLVSFYAPSTGGKWTMIISFETDQGVTSEFLFLIPVIEKTTQHSYSIPYDADTTGYVQQYIEEAYTSTGLNDFEILAFGQVNDTTFPALTEMSFEMYPEKLNTGEKITPVLQPVSIGPGHYKGQIDFPSNGIWKIKIHSYHANGGSLIDSTGFLHVYVP